MWSRIKPTYFIPPRFCVNIHLPLSKMDVVSVGPVPQRDWPPPAIKGKLWAHTSSGWPQVQITDEKWNDIPRDLLSPPNVHARHLPQIFLKCRSHTSTMHRQHLKCMDSCYWSILASSWIPLLFSKANIYLFYPPPKTHLWSSGREMLMTLTSYFNEIKQIHLYL